MKILAAVLLCVVAAAAGDPRSAKLSKGFAYVQDDVPSGPWSVRVVKIDRAFTNLQLHTVAGKGMQIGLAPLSEQVKLLPTELGRPLAAINGDYYRDEGTYGGDPKGLQIARGELLSAPCGWTCFWIDTNGAPQMTNVVSNFDVTWPNGAKSSFGLNEERAKNGVTLYTPAKVKSTGTKGGIDLVLEAADSNAWLPLRVSVSFEARVRKVAAGGNATMEPGGMVLSIGPQAEVDQSVLREGAVLRLSTGMTPELPGVQTALSGGPALVRDGVALKREEVKVRNPRSAIGWNDDYFYLVQVDGRQINVSEGMTTEELATYMARLGCSSAMSFDGGGSSTIWVYGQVMNTPSEGFEREMANALVLVQTGRN